MLLSFDGMLLLAKDNSFVPTDGKNKGQDVHWTELQFSTKETGAFTLKASGSVQVDPKMLEVPLHWELGVIPVAKNNQYTLKVVAISGAKIKQAAG